MDSFIKQAHRMMSNKILVHCSHFKFGSIIQMMHSFEVNIKICHPENSDVHRGEAEVNITFEG